MLKSIKDPENLAGFPLKTAKIMKKSIRDPENLCESFKDPRDPEAHFKNPQHLSRSLKKIPKKSLTNAKTPPQESFNHPPPSPEHKKIPQDPGQSCLQLIANVNPNQSLKNPSKKTKKILKESLKAAENPEPRGTLIQ